MASHARGRSATWDRTVVDGDVRSAGNRRSDDTIVTGNELSIGGGLASCAANPPWSDSTGDG